MSNYYNNHSQSRFMPLSTRGDNGSSKSGSSPDPIASSQASHAPPSRVPSKHFSSTVSVSGVAALSDGSEAKGKVNGSGSLHPLRHTWVFWFRQQHAPGTKVTNYEEGIKKISGFSSIESFWSLWTHLNPPSLLQPTTDYLLFHSAIRRPVWEDPLNANGGKWILRLRKGVADRLWEELIIGIVGDQFDEGEPVGDEQPDICGCTISVRQSEDIISLWVKSGDQRVTERTKETMKRILNLPANTIIEYKTNHDSLNDKSSFRTTFHADRQGDR